MAIDGIEGGASDLTRVENKDIVNQKNEIPEKGDNRVNDPGRFNSLFQNKSREPIGLRERPVKDVVELNSKPPETANARPPEIQRAEPAEIQTPPENEGLTRVNRGAVRNNIEVNSDNNILDQASARNAVRARDNDFQSENNRIQETEVQQTGAENNVANKRIQQSDNAFTQEAVEQKVNLADEARRARVEENELDDRDQDPNFTGPNSTDPVRNLDLLA